MNKPQIVLEDDVYYALMFSCLAFGGIGAGNNFDFPDGNTPGAPLCLNGHRWSVADDIVRTDGLGVYEAVHAVSGDGVASYSDPAVVAINKRKNKRLAAKGVQLNVSHHGEHSLMRRVTWAEFCKELNIVPRHAVKEA